MRAQQEALAWIQAQQHDMQQLLSQWVAINSHTFNIAGLKEMHNAVSAAYSQLPGVSESLTVSPYASINEEGEWMQCALGPCYHATYYQPGQKKVLLCGHMDTVYPEGHACAPIQHKDDYLWGPGVTDMKSGLVIMLYSLLALEKFQLNDNLGWEVIINADEEIGSPGSTPWVQRFAQGCDAGFVFEPALDSQGTFVSERKGSAKYTIVAQGKAAHAGRDFAAGRNAIVGLSRVIQDMMALNQNGRGLTINVGYIHGGTSVNIVPDCALCRLDIRYEKLADLSWCKSSIEKIINHVTQQTRIKFLLHQQSQRCPKPLTPATESLFQQLSECAHELHLPFALKKSGGCCDGNTIAMAGVPVIDTLGGCGEHIHSPQEKLLIPSLVQRTQLTTLLLARIQ